MAIRQYIGARYVTKIYENSLDPSSAEWESGVSYEPLTLVTYMNGSYLSKKTVPGSVGNPPANADYWVQTGFYNGQIASLQAQIDDINNNVIPSITSDISNIKGDIEDIQTDIASMNGRGRFIFIGDSYDNIAHPVKWSSVVIDTLGLSDSVICSYGQTGFIANITWLEKLQDTVIADEDTITDIVICGGANDSFKIVTDLPAAMATFDTYCRTRFTNLKNIYLGFVGNSFKNETQRNNMVTFARAYIDNAYKLGWKYLNGIENTLLNPNLMQEILPDDYLHPNADGVTKIGENIVACLQTGKCNNRNALITASFTTDSSKVGSTTIEFAEGINEQMLSMFLNDKNLTSTDTLSGMIAIASANSLSNAFCAGYLPITINDNGNVYGALLIVDNYNTLYLYLPSGVTIASGVTFSISGNRWTIDLNV